MVGTSKGRLSRVLSPNPYERCCRATICASGTGAARQEDKYLLDACVTSCYNVGHGPGLADWPWTEVRLAPLSLPRSTHHSSGGTVSCLLRQVEQDPYCTQCSDLEGRKDETRETSICQRTYWPYRWPGSISSDNYFSSAISGAWYSRCDGSSCPTWHNRFLCRSGGYRYNQHRHDHN